MNFYEAVKMRRSQYDLTPKSSIDNEKINGIIKELINEAPSAFNSQSSRVVVLYDKEHLAFWDLVTNVLKGIVPSNRFASTQEKMDGFKKAYGTILFFEDQATVKKMQDSFPSYSENFPIWSNQSAGMLQYAIWVALAQEGMGASLQHYNPIIDQDLHEALNINKNWKLLAQMPFGVISTPAETRENLPVEERIIIKGDKND